MSQRASSEAQVIPDLVPDHAALAMSLDGSEVLPSDLLQSCCLDWHRPPVELYPGTLLNGVAPVFCACESFLVSGSAIACGAELRLPVSAVNR